MLGLAALLTTTVLVRQPEPALAIVPAVAAQADPLIPEQDELTMFPGGRCVNGSTAPYVDLPPRLTAVLHDSDHAPGYAAPLEAEFEVMWTPPGGSLVTVRFTTDFKASGSQFTYDVPADVPEDVVVSWAVRASDGTSWGPWSSEGSRGACQFLYDRTSPSAPDIDSAEYLPADAADNGTAEAPTCIEDDEWRGSVGVPGDFTFDSASTDVVAYRYGFNTNPQPSIVLRPTEAGGPVTITWSPDRGGPRTINVVAVDRAGRSSSTASCTFRVG
jgi:hypothetical protein